MKNSSVFRRIAIDLEGIFSNFGHLIVDILEGCLRAMLVFAMSIRIKGRLAGKKRRFNLRGIQIVVTPITQKISLLAWSVVIVFLGKYFLGLLAIPSYAGASFLLHSTIRTENKYLLEGIVYDLAFNWKQWLINNTVGGKFLDSNPNNFVQILALIFAIVAMVIIVKIIKAIIKKIIMFFSGTTDDLRNKIIKIKKVS